MTLEDAVRRALSDSSKPVEIRSWSDGKLGFDLVSTEQGEVGSVINFHKMRAYPISVAETAKDVLEELERDAKISGHYLTYKVTEVRSLTRMDGRIEPADMLDKALVEIYMRDAPRDSGDLNAVLRGLEKKGQQRRVLRSTIENFERWLDASLVTQGTGDLARSLRDDKGTRQKAKTR